MRSRDLRLVRGGIAEKQELSPLLISGVFILKVLFVWVLSRRVHERAPKQLSGSV